MVKSVFYSFFYKEDALRVSQIRKMGALAGQEILGSNDWEKVEDGGDDEIKKWIAKQMKGKDCLVVLIGENTSKRRWVKYEIEKAWNDGLGVVGVHIHGLADPNTGQSSKGANPVPATRVGAAGTALSSIVKVHDTPYTTPSNVYTYIADNIAKWVDDAIAQRKQY